MSKTILYKDLIARMKSAIAAGYFMEACWIQYAIIEDRFNSVIRHAYPTKGEKFLEGFRGLDRKLEHITEKIHPTDGDCIKTVHKELLGRIRRWKDKRNDLMHEIVNTPDFGQINAKLEQLAPQGEELVNDLCNRVRKYKEAVKARAV